MTNDIDVLVDMCRCLSVFVWLRLPSGDYTNRSEFCGSSMRRLSLRGLLSLCYALLIRLSGFYYFSWPGPLSGFFVCNPRCWWTDVWVALSLHIYSTRFTSVFGLRVFRRVFTLVERLLGSQVTLSQARFYSTINHGTVLQLHVLVPVLTMDHPKKYRCQLRKSTGRVNEHKT